MVGPSLTCVGENSAEGNREGGTRCCCTPKLEGPLLPGGTAPNQPQLGNRGVCSCTALPRALCQCLQPLFCPQPQLPNLLFLFLPPLLSNNAMIQFPAQRTTSVPCCWHNLPAKPSLPSQGFFSKPCFCRTWGFREQLLQVCTASLSQLAGAWLMSKPGSEREERV